MKLLKWIALVLAGYLGVVVLVESFVVLMGARHAIRGLAEGEEWLVLTTRDAARATRDTVVAGVEVDGALYVAANHWPRAWYRRALASGDVSVRRAGRLAEYTSVPVTGKERERVEASYRLPLLARALTGFPPRSFLRLDPR
jgi:hypothetical protein